MNKFFCLGLACLLNEPSTKAQAWLVYKQTNMNELFYSHNKNVVRPFEATNDIVTLTISLNKLCAYVAS